MNPKQKPHNLTVLHGGEEKEWNTEFDEEIIGVMVNGRRIDDLAELSKRVQKLTYFISFCAGLCLLLAVYVTQIFIRNHDFLWNDLPQYPVWFETNKGIKADMSLMADKLKMLPTREWHYNRYMPTRAGYMPHREDRRKEWQQNGN